MAYDERYPEKPPGIPFLRFHDPDVIERNFAVHIEALNRDIARAESGLRAAFRRRPDDPARQRVLDLQIAACCYLNCGGFAYHWRGQTRAFLTADIEERFNLPIVGPFGGRELLEAAV